MGRAFFTVLVGAASLPLRCCCGGPSAAVQLCIAAAALAVAAPLAAEGGMLYLAGIVAGETAIVSAPATAPLTRDRARRRFVPNVPLTVIAAAVVPWSIYAFSMLRLNRRGSVCSGKPAGAWRPPTSRSGSTTTRCRERWRSPSPSCRSWLASGLPSRLIDTGGRRCGCPVPSRDPDVWLTNRLPVVRGLAC